MPTHDFTVAVEIEWQWHNAYVLKRPGVEEFLRRMGEIYEVVVYTASVSKVRVFPLPLVIRPCVTEKVPCSTRTLCWIRSMSTKR